MPVPYSVKATVDSVLRGVCPQGFKAGDTWFILDGKTPGGMCSGAYGAVGPAVRTLRFDGEYPWEDDAENLSPPSCSAEHQQRAITPDDHMVVSSTFRIRGCAGRSLNLNEASPLLTTRDVHTHNVHLALNFTVQKQLRAHLREVTGHRQPPQ